MMRSRKQHVLHKVWKRYNLPTFVTPGKKSPESAALSILRNSYWHDSAVGIALIICSAENIRPLAGDEKVVITLGTLSESEKTSPRRLSVDEQCPPKLESSFSERMLSTFWRAKVLEMKIQILGKGKY